MTVPRGIVLVAVEKAPGGATLQSFTYDGAGRRRTLAIAGGETTTYGYDALGRLGALDRTDGYSLSLAYDGLNGRASRTEGAAASLFLGELVQVDDGISTRRVFGPGLDEVIAERSGSTWRHMARDGSANVGLVLDETGALSSLRRFEAFGVVRSETAAPGTEVGFGPRSGARRHDQARPKRRTKHRQNANS